MAAPRSRGMLPVLLLLLLLTVPADAWFGKHKKNFDKITNKIKGHVQKMNNAALTLEKKHDGVFHTADSDPLNLAATRNYPKSPLLRAIFPVCL